MPNDQKPIKSSITRKQDLDNKPLKKAGDGTMGFMLWSIAGTVIAACSEPIFGEGTELTGGGGSSGARSSGPQVIATDGRARGADVYIDNNGDGQLDNTDMSLGTTNDAGYVNFDSLQEGAVVFVDVNGAVDTATRETLSGIWRSLPYSGSGDLIVSPVTNLLALRLEATPTAVGGEDAFYQEVLDSILGAESGVTVSDILDPDNYNVEGNTATQLVSRLAIGLTEIGAPTNAADSAGTLTEIQGLFATYRSNIADDNDTNDAVVLVGTHAAEVNRLVAGVESRPVVVDPNEGNTIDMTEGTDFVLMRANSDTVSLFGFEDPQRNDDADGDGVREPGQLVGIYIQALSADGNIAVRFGDAASSVALDDSGSLSAAERGVPSDGTISADGITTIGGVTFYYVSAEYFGQLILRPDANFNTENNPNPEIRFYVYDGEDATVDVGGSLDRVGSLEIEVAAVDDLATAIALTGTVTTLAENAVDSARVKVADIDITDGDGGQFGTLQLAGTDADEFEIDGTVLFLRKNAGIDHETAATIEVRVQLSEDTSVSSPDLTITVTNVDEGDASFNVASDGDINAAVAGDVLTVSLATSDPDGDGTFAYQWQRDGANITGATSATYTIAAADEDTTLTAVVMYTDGGSTSETVTTSGVTVRVPGDELATAIALDNQVTTLAENAVDSARVKVADIDITDGDGGQFGTLQLAGTDADEFEIDGTVLYLKQNANIDYDAGVTSLNVRVQLSEATSTGDDLTISITDVDDSIANVDEGDASFNVASNGNIAAAVVGDVLTVSLATPDPDGNGGFTYQWHRGGTPIDGATSTTYTIATADEGTTLTVVVTYTDGGGTGETVTTSGVTVPAPGGGDALATAITLTGTVTTLAEDAVDSARVKVADIGITDDDGNRFGTLEPAGTNANLFEVEGTDLFLRENAGIDHETAPSLVVSVRLMEDTSVVSADLTIAITNVDEGDASFNVASNANINAPVEGDELTVSLATADPDGNGNGGFTYQWQRVDGNSIFEIPGATSASYTIVAADVGSTLRVAVSYTDGGSTFEDVRTSGVIVRAPGDDLATAIALDNQVTTLPENTDLSLSRMKVADITITDEDGGQFGTLQLVGTNVNDFFEIDSNVLYLKQNADINHETAPSLVVRVQLSENTDVGDDLTISITNVDEGDARFDITSNDDINAPVAGDVLTVTPDASNPDPDGNGAFTYQWQRGDAAGNNYVAIAGETSTTYTIAEADEGNTLRVVVTYTDGGSTPETVMTSGVTVPSVDEIATAIALTATATTLAEDAVDSARVKVADIDITDEDGGSPGTLQLAGSSANLFQIDGGVLYLRQNAAIDHETAPSLVVSVRLMEDTGVTSPDLTIAITNVDEGTASFSVTSSAGSDTPAEGHVLTVARTTSDPDGDGTLAYQWHRDGTEITGEVSATYTIVADDVGTVLTVIVTYTDGGSKSETVTVSGASVPAANDNIATAIALDNQVTTVAEDAVDSARMKVADIDITDEDSGLFGTLQLAGTDPDEFEIDGTVLYLKEDANIDYEAGVTTLNVRVQLMEDTGIGANLDISITNVDEGDAGFNVTSNGNIAAAVAGDVLTVTSDASNPDPDGNGAFTYQWERDGTEITGEINTTYTIAEADEGTTLRVVVSYTDAGGFNEAVETSGVTVPVDDLATAIAFSNEVATLPENTDLSSSRRKVADIVITDGDGGRSGTLELAGANHTLFQIDGTELFLRQNASIDHETAEMLEVRVQLNEATGTGADFSIEITNVDEGTASFSVTSSAGSDTPAEGHVLTVARTTSDPDGDGTFAYEWQRDGTEITGEASATYTIAADDVGTVLTVVVSYTDLGGKSETVTVSGVSVPAANDNHATAIALDNQVTTVAEDAVDSARMKVADIDITDEDSGLFGTLELAGTDPDEFEIAGTVLYLKEGANIDYEAGVTTLNVRVQLNEDTGIGANLDISITNVDEGDAGFNVTSNGNIAAAVAGDVLTVTSDASNPDPDGNGAFTYQWERDGAEITGAIGATYTIARADEGTALTVVVSYTDAGGFSEAVETSPVTVPVDDLATAIAFTGTVVSLPENTDLTASRRKVADIVITDGDGGRSGTLELAGANHTLFQIDGTELFLRQNASIDHETAEMLEVRVQLNEATGTGADFSIEITNVDEGTASFSVTSSAGSDTPAEGHVLTVALATSDLDGDGTFTYQWQRGDADGNNYVAIAGEISTTYTIIEADEGNTLRVVVSYTDGGGKDEMVETSGVSVPLPADNPATAIALTATAVTTVDEGVSTRMKVADIDITDEDGGQFGTLELAGTNHTLFEIDLPNLDLYLKAGQSLDFETLPTLAVRVQLMGDSSVASPDLTITIRNVDEGEAGFNVASSGADINAAVEGDELTVSLDASSPDPDGNGDGTLAYQWQRDGAEITGATGATYTIVRADEGTALTAVVSYTDEGGFSEAVETSPVTVPVDDLATAIAFTGTVVSLPENTDLTASRRKVADIVITDGDGGRSGTLELAGANHTLFQIDGTELFLRQNASIDHETAEMLEVRVQLNEATGTGADFSIEITNVDEGTASFSVTSSAGSDTPAEDHVLTVARTTSDLDGDGTFSYQWQRGDADGNNYVAIASATSTTYTIIEADEGNTLRVVVSYTDGGGKDEMVETSGISVPLPADNPATAIALTATAVTTVDEGVSTRMKVADIDITDEDGGQFGTLELAGTNHTLFEIDLPNRALYLKSGQSLDFETLPTLAVRVQLVGDSSVASPDLTITIRNVDEGEAGFNVASSGADINAAVEGDELTVSLDASSPDPDGNGDGTLTYQWERDGAEINGAIGATYTIARADEGTALTVVVSYTDEGGFNEAVETSPVTVPVDDLATAIAFSNEVATLPENTDLTVARRKVADIVITDGDDGRSGTLELAGANHTLFQIDGTELFLRQNASIDHETAEMLEVRVQLNEATGTGADFSIEITNVDEGTASFSVTSSAGSDTPAEGHVLTVARTTSDLDGDGTFSYQWQRGDADGNNYVAIAGEISTTYTIIEADEGNTLRVVVSYTDGGGKSETVTTSGVSVPVPADNPATAIAFTSTVTTVAEDLSTRTKVADIDITDEDGGQFGTLELAGTNHTLFEIDLPNLDLYLKAGQSLDFETLTTLNVRVQLVGTPTVGANLDISITNVDEGEARFNVASNGNLAAAVEGDELTVSLDASSPDPDGNGDGTLTYQWERDGAEINGATDASYTIVRADEGTALTVVVSYTDEGGFSEAVETSPVTVPVDDLATAIAFTGTVVTLPEGPAAGSSRKVADIRITDGDGGRSGTLQLAGTHANLFEFGGTDNNELHLKGTVVLDHEDVEMLVVSVRLMEKTDVTSPDLTITITNVDEGQASFSVTSSAGSNTPAEGHVLTVARTTSDPDGDGTLTYQWQRGDADGNNYVAIASATSTTYTIAAADEGNTLRVVVSYTDDGNKSETVTTPGVSVPVPTDNPATAIAFTSTVTTVAEDLSTRTKVADIDITDEDGGQFGTLELAGTNHTLFEIDLPNRALYLKAGQSLDFETLTTLNVRVQLVGTPTIGANLDISITNVDEGDASFNVTSTGNLNAAAEGHVLTVARTTSDPDGDGTFTYQWLRDGTEITGATSATYTIVRADEGTALTVQVTYTDGGGTLEVVTPSSVAVPMDDLATAIALTGTVNTLPENTDLSSARRKVADIMITDPDGGRSGTLELAGTNVNDFFEIVGTELFLKQNASIDHETAATLTVRVQLNEATGTGAGLTISITNVDEGQAVFNVTSTGNIAAAAEGHILTVARATPDPDGDDGTFRYQWQRDGASIAGAISNTYTIVADDEDTTLTAVVMYTDGGGKDETVTTSDVSVPVPATVIPTTSGFYHLPAMGQFVVPGDGVTYSVNSLQTPDIIEDREITTTTANFLKITIDENGIWEAIPTKEIPTFSSSTGIAERNFYIHAHDSGGTHLGSQLIEAPFNKMNIVRTDGNSGSAANEFFIGTTGVENFSRTGGGTDVIVALEGDDTIRLGRNTSDTIYHRFSSSDTSWVNTDGGDTITNFNRNVNTFIFVDTDSSVVSESQFISSPNIRFFATFQTVISKILITKFEIRFSGEGSITFEYNAGERPDVTGRSDPASLAFLGTTNIIVNGTREITNHNVWSNYFGTNPDAFQVIGIDDDDLPPLIAELL